MHIRITAFFFVIFVVLIFCYSLHIYYFRLIPDFPKRWLKACVINKFFGTNLFLEASGSSPPRPQHCIKGRTHFDKLPYLWSFSLSAQNLIPFIFLGMKGPRWLLLILLSKNCISFIICNFLLHLYCIFVFFFLDLSLPLLILVVIVLVVQFYFKLKPTI